MDTLFDLWTKEKKVDHSAGIPVAWENTLQ